MPVWYSGKLAAHLSTVGHQGNVIGTGLSVLEWSFVDDCLERDPEAEPMPSDSCKSSGMQRNYSAEISHN